MKKKIISMISLVGALSIGAVGCNGNNKGISNEYIKISQYKGIEVAEVEKTEITDEMIETQIDYLLQTNPTITEITDRGVETGDTITIDFVGKLDGEPFENGSAEDYELVIGTGGFVEDLENGIIGHKTGETFDVDVTFAEDYQSEELAGKAVVFTVTIDTIAQSEPAVLDDAFVESVSEKSKTVEEYKEEVKADLEEQYKEDYEAKLAEEIWVVLLENTEVIKYPKDRLEALNTEITEYYETMAGYYNMGFEEFLTSSMEMTKEQFSEEVEKLAKDTIKQQLIIELIAKEESLELSEKEYRKKYEEYAELSGIEDLDVFLEQNKEEDLKAYALREVVQAWLVENCKQVDPSTLEKEEDTEDTEDTAE